jgi:hypothetical protein
MGLPICLEVYLCLFHCVLRKAKSLKLEFNIQSRFLRQGLRRKPESSRQRLFVIHKRKYTLRITQNHKWHSMSRISFLISSLKSPLLIPTYLGRYQCSRHSLTIRELGNPVSDQPSKDVLKSSMTISASSAAPQFIASHLIFQTKNIIVKSLAPLGRVAFRPAY